MPHLIKGMTVVNVAVSMYSLHREFFAGRMNVVDFVKWAGDTKAQGVELLDMFWKEEEEEVPAVLDALATTGLKVGAYAVSNNFVTTDEAKRQEQVEVIRRGVDMALRLDTKIVRVFAGDLTEGIEFEDARHWIVNGLREAAAYAEEHGVTLALENHGLLAGKSSQVKALLADVGSPALRSTIDVGNFLLVDEDPATAVANLAKLAAHVHFKDFRPAREGDPQFFTALSGKKFVGTIAGEGVVNLKKALQDLRTAGYQGWLSVEFEGLEDEKLGATQSINNLVATLAEL